MKKILTLCLMLALGNAALAQLQNADFEQWEMVPGTETINRPVGWIRSNGVPISETYGFYHPPATDAHSGTNALRLSIWYTYDKDFAYQVSPIDYRPETLTGYYKYTDNSINNNFTNTITEDSASATVYLTKWNDALQQTDTIGSGQVYLGGSEAYTLFTCPITYTSGEIPDTVKVILDCSLMTKGEDSNGHISPFPGGVGSIFTVDSLAFSQNLSAGSVTKADFTLFPNPVESILYINGFEGDVLIYDTSGRRISTVKNYTGAGITTEKFQAGTYFLTLMNTDGVTNKTFIKM